VSRSKTIRAVIRFARATDLQPLLRLVASYYKFDSIAWHERTCRRALRKLLGDRSLGRVWVIDSGAALVGYMVLAYTYDLEFGGLEGMITDLYIAGSHRGEGLGTRMIATAREFCRDAGIGTIELQVSRGNRAARSFYRALGFKAWDRIVMSIDVG